MCRFGKLSSHAFFMKIFWGSLCSLWPKCLCKVVQNSTDDSWSAFFMQILVGVGKPLTQIWEEASALYCVNYDHALWTMQNTSYAPSLYCAMNVAGIELCEIYARRKGEGEPYVWAPSSREEIIRPSRLISKPRWHFLLRKLATWLYIINSQILACISGN